MPLSFPTPAQDSGAGPPDPRRAPPPGWSSFQPDPNGQPGGWPRTRRPPAVDFLGTSQFLRFVPGPTTYLLFKVFRLKWVRRTPVNQLLLQYSYLQVLDFM